MFYFKIYQEESYDYLQAEHILKLLWSKKHDMVPEASLGNYWFDQIDFFGYSFYPIESWVQCDYALSPQGWSHWAKSPPKLHQLWTERCVFRWKILQHHDYSMYWEKTSAETISCPFYGS